MRIGIDLDDTLGHTMDALVEFHNMRNGTDVKLEEIKSWKIDEYFKLDKNGARQLFADFYASEYFRNIKPKKYTKKSLNNLKKKGHSLILVTSRPEYLKPATKVWISRHFTGIFEELHITFNPHVEESSNLPTKGEVCCRLDIDVMIDDCAEYLKDCAPHVNKVILINKPWNQNEDYLRAKCWHEVHNIIESLQ